MPVLLNIAGNLALGAALVLSLKRSIRLHAEWANWPLLVLLGFEALVFTPIATYLFRFFPQWSMLYWFDPQIFPRLEDWLGVMSLLAVILNFGAALTGYSLARLSVRRNIHWLGWAPLAVAAGLTVYVVARFGNRILFVGDYDSYWTGNAPMLLVSVPGWIGLLAYGAAIAMTLWLRHHFKDREPSLIT